MRTLLIYVGRVFVFLYPYKLHCKLMSLFEWIYTDWRTANFADWGGIAR